MENSIERLKDKVKKARNQKEIQTNGENRKEKKKMIRKLENQSRESMFIKEFWKER